MYFLGARAVFFKPSQPQDWFVITHLWLSIQLEVQQNRPLVLIFEPLKSVQLIVCTYAHVIVIVTSMGVRLFSSVLSALILKRIVLATFACLLLSLIRTLWVFVSAKQTPTSLRENSAFYERVSKHGVLQRSRATTVHRSCYALTMFLRRLHNLCSAENLVSKDSECAVADPPCCRPHGCAR